MMVRQPVGEWVTLLALVFGPGLAAALLWSPFLAADRIGSLFGQLWPRTSAAASYLLVMVGLSLPWVFATGAAMARASTPGLGMANALLNVIVSLAVVYAVGLPALAAVGLPAAGVDWDANGYGLRTWVLLVAGAVWYVALLAFPIFLVSVGLALAGPA